MSHRARYQRVQDETRVPWQVVGMIHYIEATFDFSRHLYNGDPLTARTVNYPAGRPVNGEPPFTWEQSAADYMRYLKLADTPWNVADTLYAIERVNGMGYRQHHVPSPYLWAGSNHYTRGKFVGDGQFSPTAVSQQIGLAVLLRRMVDRGLLTVGERGIFSFCIDSGR
jgi:lysozyme family protein